jgi:hypothetical protein
MATTFVGVELGGDHARPRHATVVFQRRHAGIQLRHWSCPITTDDGLLEYLASMSGTAGVIAVHGADADYTTSLLQRIWRVLDYRLLYALAPRRRTRALVRVEVSEVQSAFAAEPDAPLDSVLERLRALKPAVDFHPLLEAIDRLSPHAKGNQGHATKQAGLCAYAALWCWWHGPAGYDVLGANTDTYRLAPRMMDYEPDHDDHDARQI